MHPFDIEALEPRRLFAVGALDPFFGTTGRLTLPRSVFPSRIGNADFAVLSNGSLLVATLTGSIDDARLHLLRFNQDGSTDTRFGGRNGNPAGQIDVVTGEPGGEQSSGVHLR